MPCNHFQLEHCNHFQVSKSDDASLLREENQLCLDILTTMQEILSIALISTGLDMQLCTDSKDIESELENVFSFCHSISINRIEVDVGRGGRSWATSALFDRTVGIAVGF